jgi:hypothetical protein
MARSPGTRTVPTTGRADVLEAVLNLLPFLRAAYAYGDPRTIPRLIRPVEDLPGLARVSARDLSTS